MISIETARQLLDFSIRVGLTEAVSAKLDAKNLLDSPFERRQGDVIRHSYKTGRSVTVGLSWRLQ